MSEFFPAFLGKEQEQEPTPSEQIASILRMYGEEYGMDEETCQEIAGQPIEEAFETAYGYLTQAGIDADEALAAFMEQE